MGRGFLDSHAASEAAHEAAKQSEADRTGREVAPLSVAESAHKIGGWALVVAAFSLLVAAVSLGVAIVALTR